MQENASFTYLKRWSALTEHSLRRRSGSRSRRRSRSRSRRRSRSPRRRRSRSRDRGRRSSSKSRFERVSALPQTHVYSTNGKLSHLAQHTNLQTFTLFVVFKSFSVHRFIRVACGHFIYLTPCHFLVLKCTLILNLVEKVTLAIAVRVWLLCLVT